MKIMMKTASRLALIILIPAVVFAAGLTLLRSQPATQPQPTPPAAKAVESNNELATLRLEVEKLRVEVERLKAWCPTRPMLWKT